VVGGIDASNAVPSMSITAPAMILHQSFPQDFKKKNPRKAAWMKSKPRLSSS